MPVHDTKCERQNAVLSGRMLQNLQHFALSLQKYVNGKLF